MSHMERLPTLEMHVPESQDVGLLRAEVGRHEKLRLKLTAVVEKLEAIVATLEARVKALEGRS